MCGGSVTLLLLLLLQTVTATWPTPSLSLSQRSLTACATVTTTKILYRTVEKVRCPVSSLHALVKRPSGARCSLQKLPPATLQVTDSYLTLPGHQGGLTLPVGGHLSRTHAGHHHGDSLSLRPSDLITEPGPVVTLLQTDPAVGFQQGGETLVVTDQPTSTLTQQILITDTRPVVQTRPPPLLQPVQPSYESLTTSSFPPRPVGDWQRPRPSFARPYPSYTTRPRYTISQYTRPTYGPNIDSSRIFIVGRETLYFK